MAQSEALAGAHSYILWGVESVYNTAVTPDTHFSKNTTGFKPVINNNTTSNYGFGGTSEAEGRKVHDYVHGVLDVKSPLNFKVTTWEWLECALGAFSTDTYTIAAIPKSMTVASNIDNPGLTSTDQNVTYSGGVVDDWTLRTSVGEPVSVDLNVLFALAALDTSLDTRVALPTDQTYTFSGASIALPSGTTIPNIIDSLTLSGKNNFKMLQGLSSRLTRNALPKAAGINIDISLKYLSNDLITAALGAATPTATGGPTEYASMVLVFSNGTNTMTMTLTGVPLTEFVQIHENTDPLGEDLKFTAKDITAVLS